MNGRLDNTEQLIQEELRKEADTIERDVETNCSDEMVTDEITDEIRSNVNKHIDEYKKERLYALLPEEDRKALEIGRKVQRQKKTKKRKTYIALAAVLILTLAIGVTSLGGPERVIRLLKMSIKDREVEKVTSGEDSYISVKSKEEEAYQEVGDEFETELVKITLRPKGMEFRGQNLDQTIQMAELSYDYKGERIVYFINASYKESSWGIDIEDQKISQKVINTKRCSIDMTEYDVEGKSKFAASFSYKGLEYYLIGAMKEEDFLYILNNLHFF